jgi:hypothetical protein
MKMPCYNNLVRLLGVLLASVSSVSFAQGPSSTPTIHRSNFLVKQDCNSANCHGNSVITSELWNQSGEIWFSQDPHSFAFATLLSPESLEIVCNLWSSLDTPPENVDHPKYRQFLEVNCVACHASEISPPAQRLSGVDCQSCHGSQLAWDTSHYPENSQKWTKASRAAFLKKNNHEPIDTQSPWILARVCGSCHVGQVNRSGMIPFDDQSSRPVQQREVSHKLMAAGHPPTYFELGQYLRRYPKHWWDAGMPIPKGLKADDQKQTLDTISGRSLEAWRVGKIVNALQRLELLDHRLGLPEWPEFTEHRCTSCHHPIDPPDRSVSRFKRSTAQWDGWYLEQVDLALELTQSTHTPSGSPPFTGGPLQKWNLARLRLQSLLANPHTIHPSKDLAIAREKIAEMKGLLAGIIDEKSPIINPQQIVEVRKEWADRLAKTASDNSWESAIQIRLAADALANPPNPKSQLNPTSSSVFNKTPWDLPNGTWRPGEPPPFEASRDFDWNRFLEQLQEIQQSYK